MQSIMNSQRRLRCCLLGHALKLGTRQIYNNLTKIQHISVSVGLIPAHTGKTGGCWVKAACWWAHPRAYGERNYERQTVTPHAWLIPVYTGNTRDSSLYRVVMQAHPRVYREYEGCACQDAEGVGSSPCIQGIHLATRHDTRAKSKKYLVSTRIHR